MSGWNSNLTRCAPLRAKSPWTRKERLAGQNAPEKKPLKRASKARARQQSEYFRIWKDFIADHPACEICIARGIHPAPSTEIHHKFGRAHSLLTDIRGFVASCFGCRMWPHENPQAARLAGVLGSATLWGIRIDRHGAARRQKPAEID